MNASGGEPTPAIYQARCRRCRVRVMAISWKAVGFVVVIGIRIGAAWNVLATASIGSRQT